MTTDEAIQALASVPRGTVACAYNGKVVTMEYINPPKDRFRHACMRVRDNLAEGCVVDEKGRLYKVSQSYRMAKLIATSSAA